MARSIHETWHVRQPDFVPEGEEHKYPHLGGVFHDFIPEGKSGIDFHGLTSDATPRETGLTADPDPDKPGLTADKKGKKSA